jgi:hypothetical protein
MKYTNKALTMTMKAVENVFLLDGVLFIRLQKWSFDNAF